MRDTAHSDRPSRQRRDRAARTPNRSRGALHRRLRSLVASCARRTRAPSNRRFRALRLRALFSKNAHVPNSEHRSLVVASLVGVARTGPVDVRARTRTRLASKMKPIARKRTTTLPTMKTIEAYHERACEKVRRSTYVRRSRARSALRYAAVRKASRGCRRRRRGRAQGRRGACRVRTVRTRR